LTKSHRRILLIRHEIKIYILLIVFTQRFTGEKEIMAYELGIGKRNKGLSTIRFIDLHLEGRL